MIDEYLRDLRAQLRVPPERILDEVEDHLRESAARHGEDVAIARFGPPEVVAARFHRDVVDRDSRRCLQTLVLTGVVLFGLFLAVDLVQPRAPWADRAMPLGLEWKLHGAMLFGQIAVAAGLISVGHLVLRRRAGATRAALVALGASSIALAFHLAFQVDRLGRVHHKSSFTAWVVVTAVVRLALVGVALLLVARAARRVGAIEVPARDGLLRHGWRWCAVLAVVAGFGAFAHDEATRTRSMVDGGLEAATVVAAFASLSRPLGLAAPAAGAAYTARRTRQ